MKTGKYLKNLTLAAMFLALGIVLPFLTGQIPEIGNMLLPMHIPVLLCGLICGWQYGGAVGFITPLLRFAWFSRPPMPGAISMAFELAAYGIVIGLLFAHARRKNLFSLYSSLIVAMIAGRAVWGVAQTIVLGIRGGTFTFAAFISGAYATALPGIVIQLILIPAVMVALDRTHLVPFDGSAANKSA